MRCYVMLVIKCISVRIYCKHLLLLLRGSILVYSWKKQKCLNSPVSRVCLCVWRHLVIPLPSLFLTLFPLPSFPLSLSSTLLPSLLSLLLPLSSQDFHNRKKGNIPNLPPSII